MKYAIMVLALIGVLASPRPAAAELTGNEFLELCKLSKAQCALFIVGWRTAVIFATHGMINAKILPSDQDDLGRNPILGICFPKRLKNEELTDAFVKFLRDQPEHRHRPLGPLIAVAMLKFFPCR